MNNRMPSAIDKHLRHAYNNDSTYKNLCIEKDIFISSHIHIYLLSEVNSSCQTFYRKAKAICLRGFNNAYHHFH